MTRKSMVAILLAAWSCGVHAEQITLTLQDYPPYMGESLRYGGLLTRIVVAAFEQQKIKVMLESVPNNRAIEGVRMGIYDGGFGWAKSPERERDLVYSAPVMSLRMVFCQQNTQVISWKKLADLSPYKIGVTSGNFYSDEFADLAKKGVLHTDASGSDFSNFRKLLAGRIDLLPIDAEVGSYILAKNFSAADQKHFTCPNQAYWDAPLHVVFSRKNSNSPRWAQQFNEGLKKLIDSGQYKVLLESTRKEINQSPPPKS
jgi:polar amino acid transport system substrate-binding protein